MTDTRMGRHNAQKSAARKRQRETGESYTAALTAVASPVKQPRTTASIVAERARELSDNLGRSLIEQDQAVRGLVALGMGQALTSRRRHDASAGVRAVFYGPSGTGKELAARILTDTLCPGKELVQVFRTDFIASHVGASVPKTTSLLDRSCGDVLFVDEAEHLVSPPRHTDGVHALADSFLEEVLMELPRLLDARPDLSVILSGEAGALRRAAQAQPTLFQRFSHWIPFHSMSESALCSLFRRMLPLATSDDPDDWCSAPGTHEAFREVLSASGLWDLDAQGTPVIDQLGNARFVSLVVERAQYQHQLSMADGNLDGMSNQQMLTISPDEVRRAVVEATSVAMPVLS